MTWQGDVPSVHAGLRYGYFFLVLTRFQLLVGMRGIQVDLYPRGKMGLSAWVGKRIGGRVRADGLITTESPPVVISLTKVVSG